MSGATPAPHVVVLDDDQATLNLYRDLLTDAGYAVTLRRLPPEDPAEVVRLGPNLILLDLIFGGEETGWRFLEALQARTVAAVPVLVCTAAAQFVARVQEQINAWSCAVVLKPFDIDRLLEAVQDCLVPSDRDIAVG